MSVAPAATILREPPDACLVLAKHYEGFVATAQPDPVGIPTIGYGHALQTPEERAAYEGVTLTEDQAELLLIKDMETAARELCADLDPGLIAHLNDGQYAALVDFVFNEGPGHFFGSTLRMKVTSYAYDDVPGQLMRWVYAGGIVMKGLWRRRRAEALIWGGMDVSAAIAEADRYQ